jgi:hypothetical protein
MGAVTIQQMADRIAALLEERLRLRGPDLAARLKRAGRTLPRPVRAAGQRLAEAAAMAQNPKLLLQIDESRVAADYDLCLRHLSGLSLWDRRKGAVIGLGVSVVMILLVVGGLAAGVMYWRGLL